MNIALDIGNTRCKLDDGAKIAIFAHGSTDFAARLPEEPVDWWIASVNRPALKAFTQWAAQARPRDVLHVLTYETIPLRVNVEFPERVGMDRLLAALAVNRLRQPERAAVIVDLGTALKVDLVDSEGVFQGGAIAPGIRMSAIAMEQQTDALPELDVAPLLDELRTQQIPAIGKNTHEAISSGLYWGTVGMIQELVTRVAQGYGGRDAVDVFITGGGAETIARELGPDFHCESELVLKGIWETVRAHD